MWFFGNGGIILCVLAVLTEQKALRSKASSTNVLLRKHWRPHFAETEGRENGDLYAYNRPAKLRYQLERRAHKPAIAAFQNERPLIENMDMALPLSPNTDMDNDLRIRHLMEELVAKSRMVEKEKLKAGLRVAELQELQNRAAPSVDIHAEDDEAAAENKVVKLLSVEKSIAKNANTSNLVADISAERAAILEISNEGHPKQFEVHSSSTSKFEEPLNTHNTSTFEEPLNTYNSSTYASSTVSNITTSGTPYSVAGLSSSTEVIETIALPLLENSKDNQEEIIEPKSSYFAGLSTEAVITEELDPIALQQQLGFLQAIAPKIIKHEDVTENNEIEMLEELTDIPLKSNEEDSTSNITERTQYNELNHMNDTSSTVDSQEAQSISNISQEVIPLVLKHQTGAGGAGGGFTENEANQYSISTSLPYKVSTTPSYSQENESAYSNNKTKVSYLVADWIKENSFEEPTDKVSFLVSDWIKTNSFNEPTINKAANVSTSIDGIKDDIKESNVQKINDNITKLQDVGGTEVFVIHTTKDPIAILSPQNVLDIKTNLSTGIQLADEETKTKDLSINETTNLLLKLQPPERLEQISLNNTNLKASLSEFDVLQPITQIAIEDETEKTIDEQDTQTIIHEPFVTWTELPIDDTGFEGTVENVDYLQDDMGGENLSNEFVDASTEIDSVENATDEIIVDSTEIFTDSNISVQNDNEFSTELPLPLEIITLRPEDIEEKEYPDYGMAIEAESVTAAETIEESKQVIDSSQILKVENESTTLSEQGERGQIYNPLYGNNYKDNATEKQNSTALKLREENEENKTHNPSQEGMDVNSEFNQDLANTFNTTKYKETHTLTQLANTDNKFTVTLPATAVSSPLQKLVYTTTTNSPAALNLKDNELLPAEPTNYNLIRAPLLMKNAIKYSLSNSSAAIHDLHSYKEPPAHTTSGLNTFNFSVDEDHNSTSAQNATIVINNDFSNSTPQPINFTDPVLLHIPTNVTNDFGKTVEKSIDSEFLSTSAERLTAESSYEDLNSLEHLERVIGNYIRHESDNIDSFELERRDGDAKINFNDVYGKHGSAQVLAEADDGEMEIQKDAKTKAATETLSAKPFRTWQEDVSASVNCHTGTAGAALEEAEVGSVEIENQNETIKEIAKMPTTNSSALNGQQMKHINGQPRPQDKPMHLKDTQALHNDDIYHEGKTTEMSTIKTKLHGMTKKANDKTYDTRRQQIDSADGVDDEDNKGAETQGSGPAEIEHAGVDITPQSNGKDEPTSNDKPPAVGQAEVGASDGAAWVDTAEITKTNWWRTLPYAEIRTFLNTIFDSAAHELYEEIARKSKEMQNGHTEVVETYARDEQEAADKNGHSYASFWPFW